LDDNVVIYGGKMHHDDGYSIDLGTYPLRRLQDRLAHIHLSASQEILRENLKGRFQKLEGLGIHNLQQLQAALKDKKAVAAFALQSGLPQEYLTVLRRWVNGYQLKPIRLADFPPADPAAVAQLEGMGIKDTLQLFPRIKTPEARTRLAAESGIGSEEILKLTKLTDLARLKWVGPKFAHLLLVSGFDTVEKVARADGIALYHHLQKVSTETGVYSGGFSEDDINLWVQYIVCDVPLSIVY
jgi:hypothetical protein